MNHGRSRPSTQASRLAAMQSLRIHPEISEALRNNTPIVALESAVLTHGLPRTATSLPDGLQIEGWREDQPSNLELARAMSRCVRQEGALPAVTAIVQGTLHVGLDDEQLIGLAQHENPAKAASHNMAALLAEGRTAGTTVSATLMACALANRASPHAARPPLRVFATGGIGGVHRNWQQLPDISADLRALASTPVCVVSSGAKSILDLPATLEALETLGVPVLGYQTDFFPQFQCAAPQDDAQARNPLRLSQRVDDIQAAAAICKLHWDALHAGSSVLLANPAPREFALNPIEFENAVQAAEARAIAEGVCGAARTPFLLNEIARHTKNRSVYANLALLISNARLAARLAMRLL